VDAGHSDTVEHVHRVATSHHASAESNRTADADSNRHASERQLPNRPGADVRTDAHADRD
jgi:hypothetical protein